MGVIVFVGIVVVAVGVILGAVVSTSAKANKLGGSIE
jgi:hypothetical protein